MIKPHKNRTLFSNHYLDNLLPRENEWKTDVEPAFGKIKTLWDSKRPELHSFNESQLRKHFLDKVFEILIFAADVEPPAIGEGWAKKPDYAFFIDDNTLKSAIKKLKSGGYSFTKAENKRKRLVEEFTGKYRKRIEKGTAYD